MRNPTLLAISFLSAAPLALACKPNLGNPPSVIDGPRLLAVRGTPAEAAQNDPVTYDVLAVDVTGRIASPVVTWATCHDPRPPAEANAVATACLTIPDDTPTPTPTFMSSMPATACKQFGPQPPDVMKGMPAARPQDPDVTGGFYQPVRATLAVADDGATEAEVAFALERIKCPLANAPADATGTFTKTYTANLNPTIASLTLDPDGSPVALYARAAKAPAPAAPTTPTTWVGSGATFTLEVDWPADTPEMFPVWNPTTQMIETHREALSVFWFTTGGSFEHDRTGRDETETELSTTNTWTAPVVTGPDSVQVHFWMLLRDNRGGIDFAEALLEVRP